MPNTRTKAERQAKHLSKLIEAAREMKRINDEQRAHTVKLQQLAAEARNTGENLSHRIQPRAFDYGNAMMDLLDALEKYDKA